MTLNPNPRPLDESLKETYLARIKEALDAPTGNDELFTVSVLSRRQIIEDLNDTLEDYEQETGVEHERITEMTRAECQEYAKRVSRMESDAITESWTSDTYAEADANLRHDFLKDVMMVTLHEKAEISDLERDS